MHQVKEGDKIVKKGSKNKLIREIRGQLAVERQEEIEYGLKELIQGILIGFILGFIIAVQLV